MSHQIILCFFGITVLLASCGRDTIVPGGAEVPIQGSLEWTIPSIYITNGNASQKVSYSIYVVDRAGNQSNTLETPQITITE